MEERELTVRSLLGRQPVVTRNGHRQSGRLVTVLSSKLRYCSFGKRKRVNLRKSSKTIVRQYQSVHLRYELYMRTNNREIKK
jgi:hypothetical protein